MRTILTKALNKWFGNVSTASNIEQAEQLRQQQHVDLIVLDINLPGRLGTEWEEAFNDPSKKSDVIFMTGYADLELAISALKLGAADFILKPFNLDQMLKAVSRCMDRRLSERMNIALAREVQQKHSKQIIGQCEATLQMLQLIQQLAPSKASVLIEGESGTGKELVARELHQFSQRKGPFVAINCGALAPELLESELFGHTAGAFTGANKSREGLFRVASGGTLFLDEIGEMPLTMQTTLLRVLEQRTVRPVGSEKEINVDVRVLAATNRSLEQEVEQGCFRQDLYYRLNVVKIDVPPLRERRDDLSDLVPYFTRQLAAEVGVAEPQWAHQDMLAMQAYSWPGNVRELRNMLERCILLKRTPADLLDDNGDFDTEQAKLTASRQNQDSASCFGYPSHWSLKKVEKSHIQQVVEHHDGNKSAASRDLGVARKTLERKYKDWLNGEDCDE
ncbi:Regulatory protein AtoC [Vibrio hippocampi]|uniref:Regulatory protein AtoC n=2 Tax=Vibrio hippocampi TaxID=654686 RepID=A0ABN8DH29_9VIBR|nr:Regulatory protein AtoC [Vibrio hippocampi]